MAVTRRCRRLWATGRSLSTTCGRPSLQRHFLLWLHLLTSFHLTHFPSQRCTVRTLVRRKISLPFSTPEALRSLCVRQDVVAFGALPTPSETFTSRPKIPYPHSDHLNRPFLPKQSAEMPPHGRKFATSLLESETAAVVCPPPSLPALHTAGNQIFVRA